MSESRIKGVLAKVRNMVSRKRAKEHFLERSGRDSIGV